MRLWREFLRIYYAYASVIGHIQLFWNRIIAIIESLPKKVTLNWKMSYKQKKEVVSVTFDTTPCYCIAVCKNGNQDIIKALTFRYSVLFPIPPILQELPSNPSAHHQPIVAAQSSEGLSGGHAYVSLSCLQ